MTNSCNRNHIKSTQRQLCPGRQRGCSLTVALETPAPPEPAATLLGALLFCFVFFSPSPFSKQLARQHNTAPLQHGHSSPCQRVTHTGTFPHGWPGKLLVKIFLPFVTSFFFLFITVHARTNRSCNLRQAEKRCRLAIGMLSPGSTLLRHRAVVPGCRTPFFSRKKENNASTTNSPPTQQPPVWPCQHQRGSSLFPPHPSTPPLLPSNPSALLAKGTPNDSP